MAKTIAEMAAERDPLYAAMQPQGAFDEWTGYYVRHG